MKTIIRNAARRNFTIIPNSLLRDSRLSLRCRGLLAMILSHSDEWVVTKAWVYDNVKEGWNAIDDMFKELRACGYANLEVEKDPETKRVIRQVWVFSDEPTNTDPGDMESTPMKTLCPDTMPPSEDNDQKTIPEDQEEKKYIAPTAPPAADSPELGNGSSDVEAALPSDEGGRLRLPQPPSSSGPAPLKQAAPRRRWGATRPDRPKGDPRHTELVQRHSEAYKEKFGSPYLFQGAKDAVAVASILRACPDWTVDRIIEKIQWAWGSSAPQFIRSVSVTLNRIPSIWPQLVAAKSGGPNIAGHIKMKGDQW